MQPVRLIFDECISRPMVLRDVTRTIKAFGAAEVEVAHLTDKFPCGTSDRDWVEALVQEGGWVAVSKDRGKHSKVSEKLPLICQEVGLTLVTLSASLGQRNCFITHLALQSVYGELLDLNREPPGSTFSLSIRGNGYKLQQKKPKIWQPGTTKHTGGKTQSGLFGDDS